MNPIEATERAEVDFEMNNLKSKRWILIKGGSFLLLGTIALSLLILRHFDLQTILLLMVSIWAFCRFYYFAFYVIEHYVDSQYRFAGLLDFARYCWSGNCVDRMETDHTNDPATPWRSR